MATLLSGAVQPSLLSLLNSTSTPPLSPLWSTHTDPADPSSSFVHSIADTELRPKVARRKWDAAPDERTHVPHHQPVRGNIVDTVIHIQAKRARRTYIQVGRSATQERRGDGAGDGFKRRRLSDREGGNGAMPLGAELPFVHLQLKRLGQRGLAFEVGVVDVKGREGVIRCSSSQKKPSIHRYRSPPLLHLPLQLPEASESSMTPWMDLAINTAQLLSLFQTLPDPDDSEDDEEDGNEIGSTAGEVRLKGLAQEKGKHRPAVEVPNTQFGSISYVRVYANCRVKRIWLSAEGERTFDGLGAAARGDFALVAAPGQGDER